MMLKDIVSKEVYSRIRRMRSMGIHISLLSDDPYRILVEQKTLINGFMLSQAQLKARASDILSSELEGRKQWVTVTYKPDLSGVNSEWVRSKMDEFKVKQKDICKQMSIDKSYLSKVLSNDRMTGFQKSAFYFYFLTYELNRDLRDVWQDEDFKE